MKKIIVQLLFILFFSSCAKDQSSSPVNCNLEGIWCSVFDITTPTDCAIQYEYRSDGTFWFNKVRYNSSTWSINNCNLITINFIGGSFEQEIISISQDSLIIMDGLAQNKLNSFKRIK